MRVICPSCGEVIPGTDLDLRRGLGACRPCAEVVALPTPVPTSLAGAPRDNEGLAAFIAKEVASLPLSAYRPHDLQWSETRDGLRFRFVMTPMRVTAIPALVVAVIWNFLLVNWLSFARSDESSALGVLRVLFPLMYLSAGLAMLYAVVCLLLNRAEMSLTPVRFTFAQKPIRQRGAFTEPTRNLRTFIDAEQISKGARDRWFRRTVSWNVLLLTRDNRSILLRLYLHDRSQARYVALRLNRALDELRAQESPSKPEAPVPE